MNDVLVFIRNHWQFIGQLIVTGITIILLLFTKKVKVNDILSGLYRVLPTYINDAEKTGLDGRSKFTIVFSQCVNYLVSVSGLSNSVVIDKYANIINDSIEAILSTPNKKEVQSCIEKD